jgi:hypothetical protein
MRSEGLGIWSLAHPTSKAGCKFYLSSSVYTFCLQIHSLIIFISQNYFFSTLSLAFQPFTNLHLALQGFHHSTLLSPVTYVFRPVTENCSH